jgi:hypothetical protein
MRTNDSRHATNRPAMGTTLPSGDRRRRTRLRDLCDEVLASFRMARQQDQFTERDRVEGRRLVEQIAGRTR